MWKIHQIDVKSAFFNGVFEEEVFVEQPPRYIKEWQKKNRFTNSIKHYMG